MSRFPRLVALSVVGVLAFALAGCTNLGSSFLGVPEDHVAGESEQTDDGLQAFWLHEGTEVAIAIWGSSTCPVEGTAIHIVKPAGEGNVVSVDVRPVGDEKICTRDYVPTTTVFYTPGRITTTEPLTIKVNGSQVVLPVK